jgi:hypothetical protein
VVAIVGLAGCVALIVALPVVSLAAGLAVLAIGVVVRVATQQPGGTA